MASLLVWKDILRPIRDGYEHLFPSPDTGPTPEERAKQRESDRAKGFTYFDNFDQLENWTEAQSGCLQRANTPLLLRSIGDKSDDDGKATILLCHDYAGNYHEYEATQNIGVAQESYSCEYLQFVDTFIYFSHKLICVPPPSWTNTLHRNGVKVLGTILLEPQTKGTETLLQYDKVDGFTIASKLAAIAKHYGFDGWLVNIEKPFPRDSWSPNLLEAFLRQLRDELGPNGKLIWYDAITVNNKINYQNAITPLNLPFSMGCGNVLTNYSWKEADAQNSLKLTRRSGDIDVGDVFFGIDVWAQNTSKLTRPRITYPENGGGGTNTGIAVSKLADLGLSAGIFAPAWTFEHFPGNGRKIELALWEGNVLPRDLECSCGNASQRHPPNRGYSIRRSARRFPAGSEHFFYTDFTRAFGHHEEREREMLYDGNKLHSQLGAQSILPSLQRTSILDDQVESSINILSRRLRDTSSRTQLMIEIESYMPPPSTPQPPYWRYLSLYNLNMTTSPPLDFRVRLRNTERVANMFAYFELKYSSGSSTRISVDEPEVSQLVDGDQVIKAVIERDGARLIEIGVAVSAPYVMEGAKVILEILEICIAPQSTRALKGTVQIEDIRIEKHADNDTDRWKLCWRLRDEGGPLYGDKMMPYSALTGPVSHFLIRVGEVHVGRAYAVEYMLSDSVMPMLQGDGAEVTITGVGFDGVCLGESEVAMQI